MGPFSVKYSIFDRDRKVSQEEMVSVYGELSSFVAQQIGLIYHRLSFTNINSDLPLHFFQLSLQKSSISLVGNANLLTKVYFPRVIIPLSSVLAAMVDFGISLVLLFIAMAIYRLPLTWNVLWVIPLTLLTVFAALAVGLWLSALNVQYRDVQQMVPFLIQIWMYATPIVYPITTIPEGTLRYIYSLNPMVGVVQGFRWAFFGGTPPDMTLIISSAAVLVLLVTGLFFFRRMEKTFADVV